MLRYETTQETGSMYWGNLSLILRFLKVYSPLHIDMGGAKGIPRIYIQYIWQVISWELTGH
jgi:hypothetical protein